MHRVAAILLLCLFSFSLIGPALLADDGQSNLPSCCRKHGKHGCAMKTAPKHNTASISNLATRCVVFPQKAELPASYNSAAALPSTSQALLCYSHPTQQAQTQARFRIAHTRASQRRGPPSLSV